MYSFLTCLFFTLGLVALAVFFAYLGYQKPPLLPGSEPNMTHPEFIFAFLFGAGSLLAMIVTLEYAQRLDGNK